jgi:hypothetical protein
MNICTYDTCFKSNENNNANNGQKDNYVPKLMALID